MIAMICEFQPKNEIKLQTQQQLNGIYHLSKLLIGSQSELVDQMLDLALFSPSFIIALAFAYCLRLTALVCRTTNIRSAEPGNVLIPFLLIVGLNPVSQGT